MKISLVWVLLFGGAVWAISVGKSLSPGVKKNVTALNRMKSQIFKIIDSAANSKKKPDFFRQKELKLLEAAAPKFLEDFARKEPTFLEKTRRTKRKINKKDNLDDLYPALVIRSVNVNLDWTNFVKSANVSAIGSSFVLSDGQSLVAHVMNLGDSENRCTISSLEQDRIYRGEIKLLTEKEEVKNFIRKQSNRKNVEEFELTTPFIVSGDTYSNFLIFDYIFG